MGRSSPLDGGLRPERSADKREAAERPAMGGAGLRSVKLARTIADLEGEAEIKTHHLVEAIRYRPRRQV